MIMQTKHDKSFGIIPIKQFDGEWKVFLINQFSRIGENTYWVFPKGHPEGNETAIETARRELKEETDMEAVKIILEPTFNLAYDFVFDGVKIEKTVNFFIGVIEQSKYKLDPDEVKAGGWYSLNEVSSRLDYRDTKTMFLEVEKYLESYSLEA